MSGDEKNWIEEAIRKCEDATRTKVTILLVRCQDSADEHDVAVTNGTDAALVSSLADGISAAYRDGKDTE